MRSTRPECRRCRWKRLTLSSCFLVCASLDMFERLCKLLCRVALCTVCTQCVSCSHISLLHACCRPVRSNTPLASFFQDAQATDPHPAWIGRAWSPCSARPSRSPLCRCHRVGPSRRANTTTLRDCVCSWRQILDLHSATSSTDSCWASRRHTGTGRRHTGTGQRHTGTGRRHTGFGRRGSAPGSLASS